MQSIGLVLSVLLLGSISVETIRSLSLCAPNVPLVSCLVNPCSGKTCPLFPTATCEADYCGGCFAKWTLPSGAQVNCEPRLPCLNKVPWYRCLINPCQFAKCPRYPTAVCRPDYCGGCKAKWYTTAGLEVDCTVESSCAPGVPIVQCLVDPCFVASCPGDSTATCTSDYCGGCNAYWKTPSGEVANCTAPAS